LCQYIPVVTLLNSSPFLKAFITTTTTNKTDLRPFFRDHPCEPEPEENLWTLWCKGRLTEADTQTVSGWAPLHPDYTVPTSTIPLKAFSGWYACLLLLNNGWLCECQLYIGSKWNYSHAQWVCIPM